MEQTLLQSDAQGFLIGGAPIRPSNAESSILNRIRDDVRAIRQMLAMRKAKETTGGKAYATPSGASRGTPAPQISIATPSILRSIEDKGSVGRGAERSSVNPMQRRQTIATPTRQDAKASQLVGDRAFSRVIVKIAEPAKRDGLGRFVKKDATDSKNGDGQIASLGGKISALTDRIGGNIASGLGGADEVDPTIKAGQELASIFQTVKGGAGAIATPMKMLFAKGGEDDQPSLLKRILKRLTISGKDEAVFHKTEVKLLKGIEAKPVGAAAAAGGGFLSSLAEKIPGFGAGGLLGGAKSVGKKGVLGGLIKGFGKRLPVIGGLLSLVGAGSDVLASETDPTLSRTEKDKQTSKAVGGGVGAIGGMMGGATMGAMAGAIGGPIGVAIGGVVGGMAGAFFGEKAGDVLGEAVAPWIDDLRKADIPAKLTAAWDGFISTVSGFFGPVIDKVKEKAAPVVDAVKEQVNSASLAAKSAYAQSMGKTVSLDGGEANAARSQFSANDPRRLDGAQAPAPTLVQTAAGMAGSAAGATVKAADFVGGQVANSAAGRGLALLFSGGKRKAVETGQAYSAGNIAGLDDANTRALVATTALTESGGGKLDAVNKQGYMGRYQAGASWLASAGMINGGDKAVKDAMKADGFDSEWKWAESGGMTKFLSNDANWANGMSRSKYLNDAGAQDAAFKAVNDKNYADLVRRGAITPGQSQQEIAGLLKSAHIAGIGGAMAVSKGGTGASDANGTSARKYYNDAAKDTDGFFRAFSAVPVASVSGTIPNMQGGYVAQSVNIPDMPRYDQTAGTSDARNNVVIVANKEPVGRDLSDRRIAHIVTGGISVH